MDLKNLEKIQPFLHNYLVRHLFITLVSWPLMIWWGIPISPASCIGNLVCAPFLALFLGLSSILMACELLSLPSDLICWSLEILLSCWNIFLNLSNRSWLFSLPHPPFFVAVTIALSAFIIFSLRKFSSKLLLLGILYGSGHIIAHYVNRFDRVCVCPWIKKHLSFIRTKRRCILIDHGSLGSAVSAPKKISLMLIPFLVQQGCTRLDAVFVKCPSLVTFRTLKTLIETFPVSTLYLPAWTGSLNNTRWYAWQELLEVAQQNNTTIYQIEDPMVIFSTISVQVGTPKRKNRFHYREITCRQKEK